MRRFAVLGLMAVVGLLVALGCGRYGKPERTYGQGQVTVPDASVEQDVDEDEERGER